LRAVSGYVEVANIEVKRKRSQFTLHVRSQIQQAKILVADFTAKYHQRLRVTKECTRRAARVSITLGNGNGRPSAAAARKGRVVPTSAPE
jgi:outer membrane lipopolysaccharide assembly protein LptE/RlpB